MKTKEGFKIMVGLVFVASLIALFLMNPLKNFTGNVIESNGNLEIDLPSNYNTIIPGKEIVFTTKLLNLAQEKRKDVTLKFEILDEKNNQITTKSKTVAIETQASFVSKLEIPKETPEGKYTLKVTMMRNQRSELEGKISFNVQKEKTITTSILKNKLLFSILLITIIIILLSFAFKNKFKKILERRKIKNKIENIIKIRNQK